MRGLAEFGFTVWIERNHNNDNRYGAKNWQEMLSKWLSLFDQGWGGLFEGVRGGMGRKKGL